MEIGSKKENLHEGHRKRVRERFMKTGLNGFSDHQIIEMLLFYACPRRDTNELAHTLINKFGSLAGVFDASADELTKVDGISPNAAALFMLIPQCIRAYCSEQSSRLSIDNTDKLKALFTADFIGKTNEEFRVACFDNDLRLLSDTVISTGAPSYSPVNMRKIAETVIVQKSALIALAHNHPKGTPTPSDDDICATRQIISAMRAIGISTLDHIIVGESSALSMRDAAIINIFE